MRQLEKAARAPEPKTSTDAPGACSPSLGARSNGPAASNDNSNAEDHGNLVKDDKKKTGTKTLWVTVFKCFHCGKHGHNLPKCRQCAQAYYCDADCQRKHWKKHRPVCRAAVAALARHATRERLARAVREKGKEKVEGAEEDDLCVICLSKPVDPVEVSVSGTE